MSPRQRRPPPEHLLRIARELPRALEAAGLLVVKADGVVVDAHRRTTLGVLPVRVEVQAVGVTMLRFVAGPDPGLRDTPAGDDDPLQRLAAWDVDVQIERRAGKLTCIVKSTAHRSAITAATATPLVTALVEVWRSRGTPEARTPPPLAPVLDGDAARLAPLRPVVDDAVAFYGGVTERVGDAWHVQLVLPRVADEGTTALLVVAPAGKHVHITLDAAAPPLLSPARVAEARRALDGGDDAELTVGTRLRIELRAREFPPVEALRRVLALWAALAEPR